MINYLVSPGSCVSGKFSVPGDKSISHRALMLSAIAKGQTRISGFLNGEDTLATMAAFKSMGVDIETNEQGEVIVNGVGMGGLQKPEHYLDLGNSGTSVRLLAGLLAGMGVECELRGDASLMTRPMRRIVDPLQQMNAAISCTEEGKLPIKISKGDRLKGIDFEMPVASAQLKSSLLLAGLSAEGETCVHEPAATRDHSERMLRQFGYEVESENNTIRLTGGGELQATDVHVPADISSAAFFIVAACIAEDSDIVIKNVGLNPNRDAVIHILKLMGADITLLNEGIRSGEPVADIAVKSSQLQGIDIPESMVPSAIDEFPIIMIAAACASGVTRLTGAEELRVKESDRIAAMAQGLKTLGIDVEEQEDGMTVTGGALTGGEVDSFTDHRIAMSFVISGLRASEPVKVLNCANVETSFPGFVDVAKNAGIQITVQNTDQNMELGQN